METISSGTMTRSGRLNKDARRLRVLISAYACKPDVGSEPGIGWNTARGLASLHDVWLLTDANNFAAIEQERAKYPIPSLHVIYHDFSLMPRRWIYRGVGEQLHYYLWQLSALPVVRRVHVRIGFDVAHHITFAKYWAPACLAFLPVPFVLGPVGGAESAPRSFWPGFGVNGYVYELTRSIARWIGEHDPFVRSTIRNSALALATTQQTSSRLKQLGARRVGLMCREAFADDSENQLQTTAPPAETSVRDPAATGGELARFMSFPPAPVDAMRFVSIGRLIHWKGFHLGLEAFARAGIADAEYWIIGDGPQRSNLERLAAELGLVGRVLFFGHRPRAEALKLLSSCHIFVFPSLHDSGGWACVEAMAAGRPVICLETGGPAVAVTDKAGIRCPVRSPASVVADMAAAMKRLAQDPEGRSAFGQAGRLRVRKHFVLSKRAQFYSRCFRSILQSH